MEAHPDLNQEILKLLVQVAWADDTVEADEMESILAMARDEHVPEAALQELAGCLRGESPLPPPNFGYLRRHKELVLAVAERYLQSPDGHRARDAAEVMETIRELLG